MLKTFGDDYLHKVESVSCVQSANHGTCGDIYNGKGIGTLGPGTDGTMGDERLNMFGTAAATLQVTIKFLKPNDLSEQASKPSGLI